MQSKSRPGMEKSGYQIFWKTHADQKVINHAYVVAFLLVSAVEIFLVDRKYAVFTGGFLVSHQIDTFWEYLLFTGYFIASQYLLFKLFSLPFFYKRQDVTLLRTYQFFYFISCLMLSLIAIRMKILDYFSDAITFKLVRSLGGNNMLNAFMYAADEGVLVSLWFFLMIIGYFLGKRLVFIFAMRLGVPRGSGTDVNHKLGRGNWLLVVLLVIFLFVFSSFNRDVRYALSSFMSFQVVVKSMNVLTDFDRDGYSFYSNHVDRYPFDPERHPYALDIPDNGIDEDGLLGDYQPGVKVQAKKPAAWPEIISRKNVVLVIMESTRGDVIGKKVNGIEVAPNLNKISRDGSVIKQAFSHVGYTAPSLKSLFTGELIPEKRAESMFTWFKNNGYRVAVFSGQAEDFGQISESVRMQESSDIFIDAEVLKDQRAFAFANPASLLIDGNIIYKQFTHYFGNQSDWDKPTFIYFNLQEPHFPYYHKGMDISEILTDQSPLARSKIKPENKEKVAETYWNAVHSADAILGKIVQKLKKLGIYENTILLVSADHGESLFDDGFLGHGHFINQQQLHIPMVLNVPGLTPGKPVGLFDYVSLIQYLLSEDQLKKDGWRPSSGRQVFQYIGELNRPSLIGMVTDQGKFVVYSPVDDMVTYENRKIELSRITDSSLKKYVAILIDQWEQFRWDQHLRKSLINK